MSERSKLFNMLIELRDKPGLVDKLRSALDFLGSSPGRSVDDRIYEGTNLRKIRSGLIVSKSFNGVEYYLLGRKIWHDEDLRNPMLKTAGGYLRVAREYSPELDVSSVDGMLREALAEGLRGEFSVRTETITPFGVVRARNGKGILQFFYANLDRYPTMGRKGKAKFRPRKDHDIYVRWCHLDRFLNVVGTSRQEYDVQPETVGVLVDGHTMERSEILCLDKSDVPKLRSIVLDDGGLKISDRMRAKILSRCGLRWLESRDFEPYAQEFMKCCTIYYAIPRAELIEPHIHVFFHTDLFLHQENITGTDVDLDCETLALNAPRIVSRFVNERYYDIMPDKLLEQYVL